MSSASMEVWLNGNSSRIASLVLKQYTGSTMSESVVFESVESFMFRSSLLVLVVVESGSKIRSFQFLRKVPSSVASSYDHWSTWLPTWVSLLWSGIQMVSPGLKDDDNSLTPCWLSKFFFCLALSCWSLAWTEMMSGILSSLGFLVLGNIVLSTFDCPYCPFCFSITLGEIRTACNVFKLEVLGKLVICCWCKLWTIVWYDCFQNFVSCEYAFGVCDHLFGRYSFQVSYLNEMGSNSQQSADTCTVSVWKGLWQPFAMAVLAQEMGSMANDIVL